MWMPCRYYSYPERFQWLHVLSTGGAFLLAGAIVLALGKLLVSLRWGPKAGSNPWGSRSFEWLRASPPPKNNFPAVPVLDFSPYAYAQSEEEAHARAFPR